MKQRLLLFNEAVDIKIIMPKNINKIIFISQDLAIKINKTSPSQRCEICHQSDMFDPINAICHRCKNVSISLLNNQSLANQPMVKDNPFNELGVIYPAIIGLTLISLFFWVIVFSEYGSYPFMGELSSVLIFLIFLTSPSILMLTVKYFSKFKN